MTRLHETTLLALDEVSVKYARPGQPGVHAVRGATLRIDRGSILGLVGESGSGKTSLANAVLRLLPHTTGTIRIDGREFNSLDRKERFELRRRIQAVFQDPSSSLSPRRTVRQSLIEPLDHFGVVDRAERPSRVARALETVGLEPALADRLPSELSGGQRQRVALARALVSEPDLVIADEPVSSLDVTTQSRIIDTIADLRRSLGVAFLFISHDLGVVRRLADTVAVMYAGRIVETGPAARIFSEPAHPYTRSLLQAAPAADPSRPRPRPPAGEAPATLTATGGCVFHNRCTEATNTCRQQEPGESAPDGVKDDEAQHRVRCHLWNR